jgi:hypothetical protein
MKFETIDEAEKAYSDLELRLASLESTAEKRKQERIEAEKKAAEALKAVEGVDIEEYQTLKKAQEEAEKKRLIEEGNFNKLAEEKEKVISQLQTKLQEIESAKEQAVKASLDREKNFHLSQEFLRSGGNVKQLDNFLKVGSDLLNYSIGEDGKGRLKPLEPILGKDNKPLESAEEVLQHYANTETYGVFFSPQNNADTGKPAGTAPGGLSENDATAGKRWV